MQLSALEVLLTVECSQNWTHRCLPSSSCQTWLRHNHNKHPRSLLVLKTPSTKTWISCVNSQFHITPPSDLKIITYDKSHFQLQHTPPPVTKSKLLHIIIHPHRSSTVPKRRLTAPSLLSLFFLLYSDISWYHHKSHIQYMLWHIIHFNVIC